MRSNDLMMKLIIALFLFASFAGFTSPSYGSNANTGTVRGAFLKLNTGVKAASMGDAFVAVADDPSAIYWNPAGLTQIELLSLSSTYTSWLAGISCASISVARPMRESAMGISFNYISIGGIEETTVSQPAGTGRVFNPSDYSLTLAYARRPWPGLSLGINAKLINESIDADSSSGYGLDLGLLWQVPFDLTIGINARNLLGSLDGDPIPSNYGFGVSYRRSDLLLALDLNNPSDNQSTINFGAEYSYRSVLFGRIGYNTKSESGSGGSFGVGLGIKWNRIQLDYAYVPYGELGITHRFSLGLKIGAMPEQKEPAKEIEREVPEESIEAEVVTPEAVVPELREKISPPPKPWKYDPKLATELYDDFSEGTIFPTEYEYENWQLKKLLSYKAKSAIDQQQYDEAIKYYESILRIDPGNAFAKRKIEELKALKR